MATVDSSLTATDATWVLSGQIRQGEPIRHVRIDSSPFRVGRSNNLALSLPCPTVSNVHAELIREGGNLRVRDLGSTNGTFVNGERVHGEKLLNPGDLVQFAEVIFRAVRETVEERSATMPDESADRALALIQFDQLLAERAVVPFFQPIVSIHTKRPIGYEVLGRSRLFGLSEPKAMFTAAAVLNAVGELSRIFRLEGVRLGKVLANDMQLFLNTHPDELRDSGLLELSLRDLREIRPTNPITLEIHETAVTNASQMRELRAMLRSMNIGLAYDDFGAGQARLIELAEVPPDYLKLDANLIRGIQHANQQRQKMLQTLVHMAQDMGITTVAEGVESQEEHDVCEQVGFDLGQGFYYGKPAPAKYHC